jgi:putative transposase
MSRTTSPGSGTPYGLARVCRVWRTARATVYRHRAPLPTSPPARRGPSGPMPDAALVEAIRAVLSGSPFHGEGHRKVWARLRIAGVRTSKRRVLRLMREHGLLAPSRVGAPRGPRNHDGTIIPDRVDEMWGTDLTATWTGQGQAAVFVAVDHRSAECVGIHAAARATRFEALEPIRQGVTSQHSRRTLPGVCPSATTTAASTCRITSRRNSPSLASRVRLLSCEHRKAMAAPSASSAP